MKKITLILLLIICLCSESIYAQFGIAVGGKAGLNVSNLTKNADGTFDPESSWAGGAFVGIILCKAFAIQPEFIVRQGGATQNKNSYNTEVTLNYFQIPVLLKLRLPIGGVVFPHVFVGPSFDFTTNSSYTRTSNQGTTNTNIITTPINSNGMGGLVGGGIDFEISHLFLTIDGRYGLGFNKLSSSEPLAVRGTYYTFMAGIGYRFGSK